VKLESERDQLQQRIPGQDFSGLQLELDSKQKELGEINRRIAELKSDLVRDESMFSDSKSAIGQKQKEINDLSGECDRLAQ
jgi:chromosome segregation ATPase